MCGNCPRIQVRPLTFWPLPLIFMIGLSAQGVSEDKLETPEAMLFVIIKYDTKTVLLYQLPA